jgi:5-methylcytosine-specific restriction protein B
MSGLYLALELGTHSTNNRVGSASAATTLESRGEEIWNELPDLKEHGFRRTPPLDLRTDTKRGRAYESATIAYKFYDSEDLPPEGRLKSDLTSLLRIYEDFVTERSREPGGGQTKDHSTEAGLSDVVNDFQEGLSDGNIDFGTDHEKTVRTFVTSLATNGFVILTGVSGSGKTQIAKQFGHWLGADRSRLVPVRPDWTGSEAIFGYEDALLPQSEGRRAWHVPSTLEFILTARENPDEPYLLILDEMNLAHVERYFADALSGMESGEPCIPNLHEEEDGHYRIPKDGPQRTAFPENLFVTGTVNVDETTYMFSPKVLDRANTLEFKVATEDLRANFESPEECDEGNDTLRREFLDIATNPNWHVQNPHSSQDRFVKAFRNLHRILDGTGFEFAHRTFQEAVQFAALHEHAGAHDTAVTLDVQMLQKVLPRLHGSRRKLEPVIKQLSAFAYHLPEHLDDLPDEGQQFEPTKHTSSGAELPKSLEKLQRMMNNLRANQFASFTE